MRETILLALLAACGEAGSGDTTPPPGETPQAHECPMPTSVCSATVDTCTDPAIVEDCGTEVELAGAELRGHITYNGSTDSDDPEWKILLFNFDTTVAGDPIPGVSSNNPGGRTASAFTVEEAGRWTWAVQLSTAHSPTETRIEIDTGCGFAVVSGCAASTADGLVQAGEPLVDEVASPALDLSQGASVRVLTRIERFSGVDGWLEARRVN